MEHVPFMPTSQTKEGEAAEVGGHLYHIFQTTKGTYGNVDAWLLTATFPILGI